MAIQYPVGGGPAPINTSPYNAGSRSPRPPNNGNPRGANNMPGRGRPPYPMYPPSPVKPPEPLDPTRRVQSAPPIYNPNEVQPNGQVNKPGNNYSGARNPMLFGPQPQPPKQPMDNTMPGGQQDAFSGGGRNGSGNFQQMLQQLMERFRNQGMGGYNMGVGGFAPQSGLQNPQQQQYPPRGDGNYYGQQSPDRGRYVPPMMNRDGQGWQGQGGYNYNLPNAFGSYPGYGQGSPNDNGDSGMGGLFPTGGLPGGYRMG